MAKRKKNAAIDGSSNDSDRSAATDEQIRQRAYELYQERGGADGNEVDDWVRAEREIRERQ